jgi:hypothetical protein
MRWSCTPACAVSSGSLACRPGRCPARSGRSFVGTRGSAPRWGPAPAPSPGRCPRRRPWATSIPPTGRMPWEPDGTAGWPEHERTTGPAPRRRRGAPRRREGNRRGAAWKCPEEAGRTPHPGVEVPPLSAALARRLRVLPVFFVGATRSVSRVLSRTVISLGRQSPAASSGQPGRSAGRVIPPLFGLAAGGVCLAGRSPGRWCALAAPFHPYRASDGAFARRFDFCGTFPGVAPAGHYPAPCPALLGLSSSAASPHCARDRPTGSPNSAGNPRRRDTLTGGPAPPDPT